MEKYIPINCNYYDELEALATRKRNILIEYQAPNEAKQEVQSVIVDFFIKEKVEFLKLENGQSIRLDYLVAVDGKLPPGDSCGI